VIWKLAEAKNKLSEVIRLALDEGPQRIQRRDDAVVVISECEYLRLTGSKPSLVEALMQGPDWSELDLTRRRDLARDIEL